MYKSIWEKPRYRTKTVLFHHYKGQYPASPPPMRFLFPLLPRDREKCLYHSNFELGFWRECTQSVVVLKLVIHFSGSHSFYTNIHRHRIVKTQFTLTHSPSFSEPTSALFFKVPHKAVYKLTSWHSSWSLLLYSEGRGLTYCCGECSIDLSLMKKLSWELSYPSSCPDSLHPLSLTQNLPAAKGKKDS